MLGQWAAIAERAVFGLGVRPGDLVLVRDGTDRPEVVSAALLACERAGATPLLEACGPEYLAHLLTTVSPEHLATYDRHRAGWLRQADRMLVLGGMPPDTSAVPGEALTAWHAATARLDQIEDERGVPFLLLAVPVEARARALDMALAELEAAVLPSLLTPQAALQAEIARVLALLTGGAQLSIESGHGCVLRLDLRGRRWIDDDGAIGAEDVARGGVVSNLPAGSVYTTVVEEATEGTLWLPRAAAAREVRLTFHEGRVSAVEAAEGAADLEALFNQHTGEPRRISHIGIGLNANLHVPIGWTLVDEHIHGATFVALGENRYMGGQNASSLGIDFTLRDATIAVDGRAIVERGRVV
jgi:leucyl aminopeptidase (aminopeptidase T)